MNTANAGLWINALDRAENLMDEYTNAVTAYHSYEGYDSRRLLDICEEVADLLSKIAGWLQDDAREIRGTAEFWRSQLRHD